MPENRCSLCPRKCFARRSETGGDGFCAAGTLPKIALASLHKWEEPCISGRNGSGTIFFSGCTLKCVFCQNEAISLGGFGKTVTVERLREIFFELREKGAHNINLVNPTHFTDGILKAAEGGKPLPLVWNSGGFESEDTLRRLEGVVDIFLPDMKYALSAPAYKYSCAADYPETAKTAVLEMFRQTGPYVMGNDGILKSGVIIRHLILPNNLQNTYAVIDWVSGTFGPGDVLFSLMSQYTPCGNLSGFPELSRRITPEEYSSAIDYLNASGIEDGFFQELSSAKEEYIPNFDLSGT